ncbi:MAG: MBL fold metallo-hydrolase [Dehalococcoidia bacterium]|jgi:cyclase|nr:MBL fold metallo-hydrolase [Dehalococcoidia bacterium]MEE2925917.1 MBL fold metallo-hydrolase [Chloroflexota bacterium]HIB13155.1 MBL fold metallo-hydrolase [Dehalococcoidia bacterium]|tara:strand:+ start:1702 stop:2592 length:891 start_codon:yes stop_codon:yes gene_type:complete
MPIPSWKSGLQEVAPNVFAYIHSGVGWDICNSGFIVGDDGVLVIDAMMVASQVRLYMEEIRKVTDKPIRYVVNTHHHVDHSFGNQFYLPAEIVSHRGCREALITRGADVGMLSERYPHYRDDWAEARLTPASITYEDKMIVHLGGKVIELLHPGPAHTYGDTLVYLPEDKVLFTGDVAFHYLTPLARDGHISNWIKVANGILNHLDATTLIPGHGPVSGKEVVSATLKYLRLVKRTSRSHFQRGASVEDTSRAVLLGEYADWVEPERVMVNVQRLYQEFRGELPKARAMASDRHPI